MTSCYSPALVLLPGSLCDERLYGPQIEHFSKSYNVIVPDLSELDSIDAMARSVLASAPGTFVLAGLSMGGIVALKIMAMAPERVAGLSLLDSNAWVGTQNELQVRRAQIETVQADGEPAMLAILGSLYPRYVSPQNLQNESLRTLITSMAHKAGVKTFLNQWRAIYARGDLGHVLATISCPTLILCGADDVVCPPATHQRMADLIPHAELKIIENCGHMSTLEASDAVNTALESLLNSLCPQPAVA